MHSSYLISVVLKYAQIFLTTQELHTERKADKRKKEDSQEGKLDPFEEEMNVFKMSANQGKVHNERHALRVGTTQQLRKSVRVPPSYCALSWTCQLPMYCTSFFRT